MANEDLNLWMYVKEHGNSGLKKADFWEKGFK